MHPPRGLLGNEVTAAIQYSELHSSSKKESKEIEALMKEASKLARVAEDILSSLPHKIALKKAGLATPKMEREWENNSTTPAHLSAALKIQGPDGEKALALLERVAEKLPSYWEKKEKLDGLHRDMLGYCRVAYGPKAAMEKLKDMTGYGQDIAMT